MPRRPGEPYTVPELARELRCSDMHIYRRVADGTIPAIKLGGITRIPEAFVCDLYAKAE